jgi:ribosome recycling factor
MQTLTSTKSILDETQHRMQKTLDAVRGEFHNLRTGRASVALVETLQVDYYGTMSPLKSIASISVPDLKTISIQPWDPSVCGAIEKAILKSELGLTPSNDGKVVRIKVPALTEERRKELDKLIRKISEDGRVSIRNVRHEANEATKRLEKAKTIGEDESHTEQKKVQELTDKFVKLIDEALVKKEAELKEI